MGQVKGREINAARIIEKPKGCCSLTDETTTSGEDLVDSADKNLDVLFNVHKKVISNGGGSSSASTTGGGGGGEDEEVISVGQFLRVRTVFTAKCTLGTIYYNVSCHKRPWRRKESAEPTHG